MCMPLGIESKYEYVLGHGPSDTKYHHQPMSDTCDTCLKHGACSHSQFAYKFTLFCPPRPPLFDVVDGGPPPVAILNQSSSMQHHHPPWSVECIAIAMQLIFSSYVAGHLIKVFSSGTSLFHSNTPQKKKL